MTPPAARRFALVATLPLAVCACAKGAVRAGPPPPAAEFVLDAGDSSFWVRADGRTDAIGVRGAPLRLAHYDGRYYEVYSTDDDRSFEDALLVGERVYRRDLVSGDSLVVFADTTVPRIAQAYTAAHPDERPLAPDEDEAENPGTTATAEVDILDVYGSFLSYEYRSDVELPHRRAWHTSRQGVVDVRTGRDVQLAELFGSAAARTLSERARTSYELARDSALRAHGARDARGRRVAQAIARLRFDATSFSLATVDGKPAVAFAIPASGEREANPLELAPLAAGMTSWWAAVAADVPTSDQSTDRWSHGGGVGGGGRTYRVVARYDTSSSIARVTLADSSGREWPVASVTGPLRRIDWLDRPPIDSVTRRALMRAFSEAASYGDATRVASQFAPPRSALASRFLFVRAR